MRGRTKFSILACIIYPRLQSVASVAHDFQGIRGLGTIDEEKDEAQNRLTAKLGPLPHRKVVKHGRRCGASELDARKNCGQPCNDDTHCEKGDTCWIVSKNYCGTNPQKPKVDLRCGKNALEATDNCGKPCKFSKDCGYGKFCWITFPNSCGSKYDGDVEPSLEFRCGHSEYDARTNCKQKCNSDSDCGYEEVDEEGQGDRCWGVYANKCEEKRNGSARGGEVSKVPRRCGKTEMDAREGCGRPCETPSDCGMNTGEYCWSVHLNNCRE